MIGCKGDGYYGALGHTNVIYRRLTPLLPLCSGRLGSAPAVPPPALPPRIVWPSPVDSPPPHWPTSAGSPGWPIGCPRQSSSDAVAGSRPPPRGRRPRCWPAPAPSERPPPPTGAAAPAPAQRSDWTGGDEWGRCHLN